MHEVFTPSQAEASCKFPICPDHFPGFDKSDGTGIWGVKKDHFMIALADEFN